MQIRDRIKSFRRVEASKLKPNPRNWRVHPESQHNALRGVLAEVGYADAVLARELTDGSLELIDGHLRVETTPGQKIPVLVLDVNQEEADKLLATHDPIGAMATAETESLGALLGNVNFENESLEELMTELLLSEELDQTADDVPPGEVQDVGADLEPSSELLEKWGTEEGQLWTIDGSRRHRLLCGDGTKGATLRRLLGEEKVDLVFVDPPYNVDYVGKTAASLRIENDKMSPKQFLLFLRRAFAALYLVAKPGAAIYVCHADSVGLDFRQAFIDAGWSLKQCLVWVKDQFVMGRQDYQWRHEPILYGWKPGGRHHWHGGRGQSTVMGRLEGLSIEEREDGSVRLSLCDGRSSVVIDAPSYELVDATDEAQSSVWRFAKPKRNALHPTMKPIELVERAVLNSSKPGEVVCDSFVGSGTTMIAAEQLDRACHATEIDPRYAAVVLERMELLGCECQRE